jgi:hypothetical protein
MRCGGAQHDCQCRQGCSGAQKAANMVQMAAGKEAMKVPSLSRLSLRSPREQRPLEPAPTSCTDRWLPPSAPTGLALEGSPPGSAGNRQQDPAVRRQGMSMIFQRSSSFTWRVALRRHEISPAWLAPKSCNMQCHLSGNGVHDARQLLTAERRRRAASICCPAAASPMPPCSG